MTISVNGYRAFEKELLSLREYNAQVEAKRKELLNRGFDAFGMKGDHLLVSMNPDGVLRRDEEGAVLTVLCNFGQIRAPWMSY